MFGNWGMHRQINTQTLFPLLLSVSRSTRLSPLLLLSLSLSISEEDLMNISLWVGECKTNTSLVLLSLCVLPWRGKCEMHEKAVRRKITYSLLASALPPLLSPNPLQSSDHLQQHGKHWWQRAGMRLMRGRQRRRRKNLSAAQTELLITADNFVS